MTRHSGIVARISSCASNPDSDPRHHFDRPQSVVDAQAAPYEMRLSVLQRWRRLHPDDEQAVAASINALEAGAAMGTDLPDGTPNDWGYGARSRG